MSDQNKKQKEISLKISKLIKYSARIGTGIVLLIFAFSCARVPVLKDEVVGTVIKVPFVRVLVADGESKTTIKGDGAFAIECLKDGKQSIYYSNKHVSVENRKGKIIVRNNNGQSLQSNLDEVNIIPRGLDNRIYLHKKKYRGIIKILPTGQNLSLINIIYIEDYLKGVVPPEIGNRSENEIEAVKAQAVAARTYAMAHLKQYPDEAYDMRSSIIDQVYEGANVELKLINRAIEETSGQIIMHNDKFINAYYHSTCGGMTDDIEDVWDRKEIPYLKAVADSNACSWSKYFNWNEVFTEKQLRGRIEQYLSSDRGRDLRIGRIEDLKIGKRSPGGRVAKLSIRTERDVFRFAKDRIRWVIGRTSNPDLILPSDRFDVKIDRDGNNNIKKITFSGSGYGHGVGMCQCGAIGLARNEWTYKNILTHYYSNVEIKKLY